MKTPIVAVHLFYAEGMFPATERWVSGVGFLFTPEQREEVLCAQCVRKAWRLIAEPDDADVQQAAIRMVRMVHLAEMICLLEQDMVEPGQMCRQCHVNLYKETTKEGQR
jgi:hypothetical protein